MRATLALVAALIVGCGYGLPGSRPRGAPHARTISIELFQNHTREPGLDVRLRDAVADEFRRRSALRVVPSGEGDLVLKGDIRRFSSVPVAFSPTDEAVQYQGVMQVTVRLVERTSGQVLHATPRLQATQDFGAVRGIVVSSSPSFQRDTINARDLVNLTNAQIGPARRRAALRDLVDLVARDVYLRAMGDF